MKTIAAIVCIIIVIGATGPVRAGDEKMSPDIITAKVHKETKDERDRSVTSMMRFSNTHGRQLMAVIDPGDIEKILVRYGTQLSPSQISYLFQRAVFRRYEELPPAHLAPAGSFSVLTKNQTIMEFQMFLGAPVVRVNCDISVFWLEIPDYVAFTALGK